MLTAAAPLAAIAAELRSGRKDLRSYINSVCDRIETVDVQVQALLPETDRRRRLLLEAAALEQRFPRPEDRPPLYGVLLGVKDIFRAGGFPTRAGSLLPPDIFAGAEAAAVSALRRVGGLVLGKTVTTEFAHAVPGPTRNPHNLAHTPGGSSSGSAAAVAAGLCPLALGTQTIGSVIRPAAFCGIVGFKPSYGRIDTSGLIIFSASADHVGFFTQDLAGARLASSVMVQGWAGEGHSSPQSSLHSRPQSSTRPSMPPPGTHPDPVLGVPDGPYLRQASAAGLTAFGEQLGRLASSGLEIRPVAAMPDIEDINRRHRRMTAAELATEHASWFAAHEPLYRPRTVATIRDGQGVSAEELEAARAGRLRLRRELETLMAESGVDLLVCPSAPGPAPAGIESTGDPVMNLPWTHAGLPVVTLPAGPAPGGLPLGLQVIARFGQDEVLLNWASRLQYGLGGTAFA